MATKENGPSGANGEAEDKSIAARPSLSNARSQRRKPPAVEFLQHMRPGGPWVLTAIKPDGPTDTVTLNDSASVDAFVAKHNGKSNIYHTANPTTGPVSKKPLKTDIAGVEFLHVDIDPAFGETPVEAKARALKALEAYERTPTAIVDSGNGIQAYWRLDEPVDIEEGESRNRGLIDHFGGDKGTHNADRLLRVPGTRNLPNKVKRDKGRVECDASIVELADASYPIGDFPTERPEDDIDALPVSPRIKNLIRGIDDPDHIYASRSERVFAVLVAMAAAECTDDQMIGVMDGPVGDHVRDQGDPDEYLRRQIEKARAKVIDPIIAKMNETYAFVLVGDKGAVMETVGDEIKFLSMSAFEQWHANRFVEQTDGKRVTVAKYWMQHRQRRQYRGLAFNPDREVPGYYNLWRGFAVEPKEGDCSKFLAHIKENVARGDEMIAKWAMAWLAQMFQHPTERPGTALVLRGKQGVGKTVVGEIVGSLLGTHYIPVSDPRYITGRFNSHLGSCVLFHADEAFWAGDHAAEGKLKDLITGQWLLIELKGKEPIKIANNIHMLICGNSEWLAPAGLEERRFAVLDVGDDRRGDHDYFAAIHDEMRNGGREALLHYLLHLDISDVNLRVIPRTEALLDQQIASFTPEETWLLDLLMRGELGVVVPGECPTEHLFERYVRHANRSGVRRKSSATKIGMFLSKRVPGLKKSRERYDPYGTLVAMYRFPSLAQCRDAFAQAMQQDIKWGEPEEWVLEVGDDGDRWLNVR